MRSHSITHNMHTRTQYLYTCMYSAHIYLNASLTSCTHIKLLYPYLVCTHQTMIHTYVYSVFIQNYSTHIQYARIKYYLHVYILYTYKNNAHLYTMHIVPTQQQFCYGQRNERNKHGGRSSLAVRTLLPLNTEWRLLPAAYTLCNLISKYRFYATYLRIVGRCVYIYSMERKTFYLHFWRGL